MITWAIAAVYVLEYHYVYYHFTTDVYGYTNITHLEDGNVNYSILFLLSLFPLLYFKGIRNVASFFSFMIYVLVYIPFINTLHSSNLDNLTSVSYSITFLIIMSAFFLSDNLVIGNKKNHVKSEKKGISISYGAFSKIIGISFVILIFLFRNQMNFYNFLTESDEMYEFRLSTNLSSIAGSLGIYLLLWMENVFLPILLVCSYQKKKYIHSCLVLFAFILVFMVTKTKTTIVMPFFMLAILFFYSNNRTRLMNNFHLYILVFLACISYGAFKLYESNPEMLSLTTLIDYRIQGVEGAQLERYLRFFSRQPYTYYSHIQIVNWLFNSYPFPDSIGRMVAGNGANSNATFLLMDGVAACGVVGCFIVSVIFIIIKAVLNWLSEKCDYILLSVIFIYSVTAVANVSLFTSLVSCGLLPMYFLLRYINIPEINKK